MAKTHTKQDVTPPQDETKQQREKQAKREAKLMLKVEDAQRAVRKAEKKVTKAQSNLEASTVQLRDLAQKLAQLRAAPQETPQTQVEVGGDIILGDTGDQYDTATPADQGATLPPAEGREDITAPEASTDVAVGQDTGAVDAGDQHDTGTPADQGAALPPVEGREDVSAGQNGTQEALPEMPHPASELEAMAEDQAVTHENSTSDATPSQEEPTTETTTDEPNRAARRSNRRTAQE